MLHLNLWEAISVSTDIPLEQAIQESLLHSTNIPWFSVQISQLTKESLVTLPSNGIQFHRFQVRDRSVQIDRRGC